jgi:hypothetical protein
MTVSGRTMIRHERQSHHLEIHAKLTRVAASMRRGFTPRLVEGELTPQDEIFNFDRAPRSDRKPHQADEVGKQQQPLQRGGSSTRGYQLLYCGPQVLHKAFVALLRHRLSHKDSVSRCAGVVVTARARNTGFSGSG